MSKVDYSDSYVEVRAVWGEANRLSFMGGIESFLIRHYRDNGDAQQLKDNGEEKLLEVLSNKWLKVERLREGKFLPPPEGYWARLRKIGTKQSPEGLVHVLQQLNY